MKIELTKRLEHICLQCALDLKIFGVHFEKTIGLPAMEYGFENETEWLCLDLENFSYNISRPFIKGTLQEWDKTTPIGCNFGIVISIHQDHPFVLDDDWVDKTVADFCKNLANCFNTKVYHHRSFIFGIDKSELKQIEFTPQHIFNQI